MTKYILIAFGAWNIIVFFIYGWDKLRAKTDGWRVSEKALLLLALFFGGTGALLGMGVFHHKTLHKKFTVGVPLLTLLNYVCVCGIIWLIGRSI